MLTEEQIKQRIDELIEKGNENTWNGYHNDNEIIIIKINELETVLGIPESERIKLCKDQFICDKNMRRFRVIAGYEISGRYPLPEKDLES